jgi:hypothetical protein
MLLKQPQFPVFIVVNQAFVARSRQNAKKSAGLARLTRVFFRFLTPRLEHKAQIQPDKNWKLGLK